MDFPSNSHNVTDQTPKKPPKASQKKAPVEKVVTGEVVRRKTPISKKIKTIFFGGEIRSASSYVASEVLLPALRKLVVDTTSMGIERFIYGDSQRRPRTDFQTRSRVSYNAISNSDRIYGRDPRRPGILPDQPPQPRRRVSINEIIISSKSEAEMVVERLNDIIDKYDVASVADFYDLLGLPTSYVDNSWGWTSLAYADIRQTREGVVIDLPNPEPIN